MQAAEGGKGQLVFKAGLQRVLCLERGPAATGAPGAREGAAVPSAGDKARANSVTRGDGGACAGPALPLCTPFPCAHSSASPPVPGLYFGPQPLDNHWQGSLWFLLSAWATAADFFLSL